MAPEHHRKNALAHENVHKTILIADENALSNFMAWKYGL